MIRLWQDMKDRELLAWLLLIVMSVGSLVLALWPQHTPKPVVNTVYSEQPKGTWPIPSLSETVAMTPSLYKECRVFANFQPDPNTAFRAGQRYYMYCKIVKGPHG